MKYLTTGFGLALAATLLFTSPAKAQSYMCEEQVHLDDQDMDCYREGPQVPVEPFRAWEPPKPDPLHLRLLSYAKMALRHRMTGLASYYSTSLNGTLTANGERYYNKKISAAHLTLPLGTWVEVKSRATGRKIRLRVNDRGPYVHKFIIDLSQAAAKAIGVDIAEDRTVEIRIVAMPGETPLPADFYDVPAAVAEETTASPAAAAASTVVSQR